MKTYMLDLNSIERVKGFVSAIEKFDGYFDIATGRYVVDAKSIMGIFSMDLSRKIEFQFSRQTRRSRRWRKQSHPILHNGR